MENDGKSVHALIINDSRAEAGRIEKLLQECVASCTVRHAETLKQGLEFITVRPPDLVFLDVGLPDGSGIDMLEFVKLNYPDTRVVIISNFDCDHLEKKSADAECSPDKAKDVANEVVQGSEPQGNAAAKTRRTFSGPKDDGEARARIGKPGGACGDERIG